MAATDQFYRSQKTLDLVFGVSCALMLLVTLWMLYDDYNRPYKPVQRKFRDVETALNSQEALNKIPELKEIRELEDAVKKADEKYQAALKEDHEYTDEGKTVKMPVEQ